MAGTEVNPWKARQAWHWLPERLYENGLWPDWADPLETAWNWIGCHLIFFGHDPVVDHCGRPEHDYCAWCGKLTPGRAHV